MLFNSIDPRVKSNPSCLLQFLPVIESTSQASPLAIESILVLPEDKREEFITTLKYYTLHDLLKQLKES